MAMKFNGEIDVREFEGLENFALGDYIVTHLQFGMSMCKIQTSW